MKVEVRDLSGSRKEFLFEVKWDDFQVFFEKALKKAAAETELKGFRKGRAPSHMVEGAVGTDSILTEAAGFCIKEKLSQYIRNQALEVLEEPKVDVLKIAKGNPFCFKAEVSVMPDITLPDYKEIAKTIRKEEVEVSEKEIEQALQWLRRSRADFKDLERKAYKGDFVHISYQSQQLEKGRRYQDAFVLGRGGFVPGFEEQLQGLGPGQDKEFRVQFPDDYKAKNLAGKEVEFKVRMEKVQEMLLPELNDQFARNLGKFDSLADLKKNLKQNLLEEKKVVKQQERRAKILKAITDQTECELPQALVDLERVMIKKQIKSQQEAEGADLSKKQIQDIENQAKIRTKNLLVLRALGKEEGVEVEEREVEAAAQDFLKRFQSPAEAQKEIDPERLMGYYRHILYQEKVFQALED